MGLYYVFDCLLLQYTAMLYAFPVFPRQYTFIAGYKNLKIWVLVLWAAPWGYEPHQPRCAVSTSLHWLTAQSTRCSPHFVSYLMEQSEPASVKLIEEMSIWSSSWRHVFTVESITDQQSLSTSVCCRFKTVIWICSILEQLAHANPPSPCPCKILHLFNIALSKQYGVPKYKKQKYTNLSSRKR